MLLDFYEKDERNRSRKLRVLLSVITFNPKLMKKFNSHKNLAVVLFTMIFSALLLSGCTLPWQKKTVDPEENRNDYIKVTEPQSQEVDDLVNQLDENIDISFNYDLDGKLDSSTDVGDGKSIADYLVTTSVNSREGSNTDNTGVEDLDKELRVYYDLSENLGRDYSNITGLMASLINNWLEVDFESEDILDHYGLIVGGSGTATDIQNRADETRATAARFEGLKDNVSALSAPEDGTTMQTSMEVYMQAFLTYCDSAAAALDKMVTAKSTWNIALGNQADAEWDAADAVFLAAQKTFRDELKAFDTATRGVYKSRVKEVNDQYDMVEAEYENARER